MRIQLNPLLGGKKKISIANLYRYLDAWEQELELLKERYGGRNGWAFDYECNHYLNLNACVLNEQEGADIFEAHRRIVKLLHFMTYYICSLPQKEREQILSKLGIPQRIFNICPNKKIPYLTALGRFDWIIPDDGVPRLLEFNSETPLAMIEGMHIQKQAHKFFPSLLDPNITLAGKIGEALRESFRIQGGNSESNVALVGYLSNPEEFVNLKALLQVAEYPAKKVVLEDVHKVFCKDGKVFCGEIPVDIMQSTYSVEWFANDIDGSHIVEALESGALKLINPPQSLMVHSKAIYALAWLLEMANVLGEEDAETVRKHIPFTSFDPESFLGEDVIIKVLHGREGDGIKYLKNFDQKEVMSQATVIYQEFIQSKKFEFPVIYNGRPKIKNLTATISTYSCLDQPVGFYTRLGEEVVDRFNVAWVPTYIEQNI